MAEPSLSASCVKSQMFSIGVDVGTGSVRAALVSHCGDVVDVACQEITVNNPRPDHYQQSSVEIWRAVCECTKTIVRRFKEKRIKRGDEPRDPLVTGIGFAATCSLVVVGKHDQNLSIDLKHDERWDVIMWMDHRAREETDIINRTRHRALTSVGGFVSIEMQIPKLAWIKRNLPETWSSAEHFFDLCDFLCWRASKQFEDGKTVIPKRSLCSTVCKWTYRGDCMAQTGWSESFLQQIGLSDLFEDGYKRIGVSMKSPGEMYDMLSEEAADEMEVCSNNCSPVRVSVSAIDAHAGALGMLAIKTPEMRRSLQNQLCLVAGTSACHLIFQEKKLYVPGVWGPYPSALLPGLYLHEGGQSAVGHAMDYITQTHPAFEEAKATAAAFNVLPYEYLHQVLKNMCGLTELALVTKDIHIRPDFRGNRSPIADFNLKANICGLTMDRSVKNLAVIYLAAIQSMAYGTKHIVQTLKRYGHKVDVLTVCGGLSRNTLYVQSHADILGLKVIRAKHVDAVLLGAAMLGRGIYPVDQTDESKMKAFEHLINGVQGEGDVFSPNENLKSYHEAKYNVFLEMLADQQKYSKLMA